MKKLTGLVKHPTNFAEVVTAEEIRKIRLSNIIDLGLTASGMIRLFKKESKAKLHERMLSAAKQVFKATSEEEFRRIHSEFCEWGSRAIFLAKDNQPASYGQIAKTLNVALKVAIYYCHLPEYEKSKRLLQWLDAAVDNKMMSDLKQPYHSIQEVKRGDYFKIQDMIRKFIREKHRNSITPVQFEDYLWRKLNRKDLTE